VIYMNAKFEVSSFNRSRNMEGVMGWLKMRKWKTREHQK